MQKTSSGLWVGVETVKPLAAERKRAVVIIGFDLPPQTLTREQQHEQHEQHKELRKQMEAFTELCVKVMDWNRLGCAPSLR